MEYFRTGFLFICLATSYLNKFESKLRPSSNMCETKIHQRKNATTLRRKEKQEKFITTKWIARIERTGIFTKQELEKNVKEKTSAYITLQASLWCKECLLIHLEGLKNTSLWVHVILFLLMYLQSCQLETLKKLVNVSTVCPKTLVMFSIWWWAFLFSDRTTQKKKVLFDQVSWGYQITPWKRRMSQKKFDSV